MMKKVGKALMAGAMVLGLASVTASAQQKQAREGERIPQRPNPLTCEPQLELSQQPDGQYTLTATTYMPNSCFTAQEARQKTPEGVAVTPETLPVVLNVEEQGTICLQYLKPVRHQVRNLEVTRGKSRLTAFVMRDGEICGRTSVDIEALPPKRPTPVIDTSDWYAQAYIPGPMLPVEPKFTLEGNVTLPTPCHEASLVPADVGATDPGATAFRVKVDPPAEDRACAQRVVTRTVRYEGLPTGADRVDIYVGDQLVRTVEVDRTGSGVKGQ